MSLRFLAVLLRAPSSEQRQFYARQLPVNVFNPEIRAQIRWVYDYRARLGKYPSPFAFRERFPDLRIPLIPRETITSALKPVLDNNAFETISELVKETKQKLNQGDDLGEITTHFKNKATQLRNWAIEYDDATFLDGDSVYRSYRDRQTSQAIGDTFARPTPWNSINDLIGFYDVGEFVVIAARLGQGKSWLLLNWADYFNKHGESVLVVSKEMPTIQIQQRLEALRFQLPYSLFRRGELPPKLLGKWRRARYAYETEMQTRGERSLLHVTGHEFLQGIGFDQIYSRLELYHPAVLMVDGAYLLKVPEVRSFNKVDVLTEISNQLKRIAKAFKIRVIVTVQLNREAEDEDGKQTRGGIQNIYGSDSFAQDADFVLTIRGTRGTDSRIIEIEKGRESGTGEVSIRFQLNPYPFFGENVAKHVKPTGLFKFK